MTIFMKTIAPCLGLAAMAAAAPAVAQYGYPQYGAPYGNAYGYNNNMNQIAAQRCSAAVQNRLSTRVGLSGILGAVLGNQSAGGRVLAVNRVENRGRMIRVRGVANSGSYGDYGYGAYGAVGYAYQPDLSFRCDVDFRGRVRNVDINRRR